ncbi:hypothetical protein [Paludibacter jiangxiensis]|uniref:BioF2-like acetyltransferase domain-containing protein n=1 Tax=Paludibacter jiangxiensis TaxID=681398 RepID=A0A170ZNF6_9BACT|nr:hypothetical protein [Paludibacter jiangxiensis]GAT62856.1 hypothetical protein PJIAN_3167 [Paludibacter jiangxiensis]
MYEFNDLGNALIPWDLLDKSEDQNVFKTREWLEFLRKTQHAEPCVVEIYDNGNLIGYFVGENFRKVIKIVASPFEGCSTGFQGLNMLKPITATERVKIYESLILSLFRTKQCLFFQATDWQMSVEDLTHSVLQYEPVTGYSIDLTQSEDLFLRDFNESSRKNVNKSVRRGVLLRQAENPGKFVDDYYSQLQDVFSKQGLKPTYSKNRVTALVDTLYPTGNLLLLESLSPEGKSIATGLFLGKNKFSSAWGQASYKDSHSLFPNEAMWFEAMRYWKNAGATVFELGGGGEYKKKYGGVPYVKPRLVATKYQALHSLKQLAKRSYYFTRKVASVICSS